MPPAEREELFAGLVAVLAVEQALRGNQKLLTAGEVWLYKVAGHLGPKYVTPGAAWSPRG